MTETKNLKRILIYFLLINGLVWSLVPLLRLSLPMDTQEAIVWGKFCLWGTTKHPPFSGWIAYPFWLLFAHWDGAMYLLSQICVALGVIYIYRLARQFFDTSKAVLAALLQFGVIYYNFSSVEFNVNVVSLALWPMAAFYFWRAYNQDKWHDWLLFGVLVGLNLLNKYISGILFLSLALFVLADGGVWRLLKNIKVYAAVVLCSVIVAPHLWWLWQNDFEMWHYMASRSAGGKISAWWRHLAYPLKFLAAQILFSAPAWLTYACFRRKNKSVEPQNKTAGIFIAITAVVPVMIFMLISLISGNALKSMWGFPCLYMLGIALFYFWPIAWSNAQQRLFVRVMFGWSVLFAVAYGAQCVLTKSERFRTNCPQLAQTLVQEWQHENGGAALEYVGGDVWFSDMLTLYGGREIKPMIWLSPKNNPWFDAADFGEKGALVVATDAGEYAAYQTAYPQDLSAPRQMSVTYQNAFGKSKTKTIFYGFLRPREVENGK